MNIEYYAKNGITLPMIPQWEMYYNSLAKHIGYQGAALLYRKDRLWRSLELKNARTEAGTTTRRFLD